MRLVPIHELPWNLGLPIRVGETRRDAKAEKRDDLKGEPLRPVPAKPA
jgi:hypothetical protein